MSDKNVVVFYDAPEPGGCADGAGSDYGFHLIFGMAAKHVGLSHGKQMERSVLEAVKQGNLVYFADIAPTRDILEKLVAKLLPGAEGDINGEEGKMVVILDHHQTTRDNLQGYSHPAVKMDIEGHGALSAAGIVWQHFNNKKPFPEPEIPEWLRWIGYIDNHLDKKKDFYPVAAFIDALDKTSPERIVESYGRLEKMTMKAIIAAGNEILNDEAYKTQLIDAISKIRYARVKMGADEEDLFVPIAPKTPIQLGRLFPTILKRIAEEETSGVSGCYYEDRGTIKVSLRSNDGEALRLVNKIKPRGIGGGGHDDAAVVMFEDQTQLEKVMIGGKRRPDILGNILELLKKYPIGEAIKMPPLKAKEKQQSPSGQGVRMVKHQLLMALPGRPEPFRGGGR